MTWILGEIEAKIELALTHAIHGLQHKWTSTALQSRARAKGIGLSAVQEQARVKGMIKGSFTRERGWTNAIFPKAIQSTSKRGHQKRLKGLKEIEISVTTNQGGRHG